MKKLKITLSKKQAVELGLVIGVVGTGVLWWKLPVGKEVKREILDVAADYILQKDLDLGAKLVIHYVAKGEFFEQNHALFNEFDALAKKLASV